MKKFFIQCNCNFSLYSQGNFGSMNASPAWGSCVAPKNESENKMQTLILREVCSLCTFAYLWTTCHCSELICCMEIVQRLIDQLNLSGLCSSCASEQIREARGVMAQGVSKDFFHAVLDWEGGTCNGGRPWLKLFTFIYSSNNTL